MCSALLCSRPGVRRDTPSTGAASTSVQKRATTVTALARVPLPSQREGKCQRVISLTLGVDKAFNLIRHALDIERGPARVVRHERNRMCSLLGRKQRRLRNIRVQIQDEGTDPSPYTTELVACC